MEALNKMTTAADLRAGGVERGLARLQAMGDEANPAEAAAMFESLLATMLVKEARKSLGDGGFFGEGPGADVFSGWLDQHVGEALADGWDLDLAGMVRAGIVEKQEGSK
ncbi:MAG: rod-binding protein [Planctomycetes bacterium]|nr:rod-binding protein [Planctomycetota bacterium]